MRRDLSGHVKKAAEQGTLTCWRWQRDRPVRTQKESDRASGTHILKTAERETSQDTERKQPTEGHSLPGDHRGGDLSGHRRETTSKGNSQTTDRRGMDLLGKKATDRVVLEVLTNWRPQREGLVRTWKESE